MACFQGLEDFIEGDEEEEEEEEEVVASEPIFLNCRWGGVRT